MATKSDNYQKDIHDRHYEAFYLAQKLDASTLVSAAGRKVESMSGQWRFAADWYDSCRRASWWKEIRTDAEGRPFPVDWDWEGFEYINLPSTWNLEKPELMYFEGSGIYTRTFSYLAKETGERVFLRFEGAQYRTSVFLNGKHLGTHDGGSTPFSVEISDAILAENRLIVVVEARRKSDRVPSENTDWFNYGGVYREVSLIRLPRAFIRDWFLRLSPVDQQQILLDVETSGEESGEARLRIPELGIDVGVAIAAGKGRTSLPANPESWSPEHPRLYDVELSFGVDKLCDRVGFRDIKVQGNEILLNGTPIYLKGISLHEDHVITGKTTDEAAIRMAIRHLRELHGNYLRLAHYPHDPRFARIADEEGILLWEELPVYWAIEFDNPGTYADAENQLLELIRRDRNRASVIIWSVGNENADSDERLDFMTRLVATARAADGTRPVSAACLVDHNALKIDDRLADALDIIGINEYYGWYEPDFTKLARIFANSKPTKPVIICEFGADARKDKHGTIDDLWTEEHQARLYERQLEVIGACSYIKGLTPWILYDFRCPRRLNRYQQGFNRKGLIDADRKRKKLAFDILAKHYAGSVTNLSNTFPQPKAKAGR